jgi:hypothetical protein
MDISKSTKASGMKLSVIAAAPGARVESAAAETEISGAAMGLDLDGY